MVTHHNIFHIAVSDDRVHAEIELKEPRIPEDFSMDENDVSQLLNDYNIKYGIDEEAVRMLRCELSRDIFPLVIAKGKPVVHGEDGRLNFMANVHPGEINRSPGWNFRDVMSIPSVKKGEKIAEVILPAEGENGKTVHGTVIRAKKGKPSNVMAGKNVVFLEDNHAFYAAANGQLSISGRNIHVHPVFEVDSTLSMKEGNLDFTGTIIIRGDVPAGYSVKAEGDIKVFGIVEAATLMSGGSIFIAEGLAGQKKGYIKAEESIRIGYINQGKVFAGNDLFVENSIIHSTCTVKNHVFCQKGNIIGGSLSVGKSLAAKDIGSRFGTKTEIIFGMDQHLHRKEEELFKEKQELEDTIQKLTKLGEKIKQQNTKDNPKLRIMLLKQRNSYTKAREKLSEIERSLGKINAQLGSENEAELIVNNYLFSHVTVAFGKYKRIMKTDYHYIRMFLSKNEIVIEPLFQ
ncbi:FapA family protein [Virgibacillus sp. YIM 98842]|uniref:DUF342 domain-containing protein n=1 Tax=Virgibacillus sp. YIM 98842 TaxID=2663533 RepID=UPI0013D97132|nr:FapA family protein [Virgibacillus sp. YIM 98842]